MPSVRVPFEDPLTRSGSAPGVGLFAEDPLNPLRGRDYLLHGAAAEFLDFRGQGAVNSTKKRVNCVAFCRFSIAGMQAFGKLFSLTCELHYFLGASLKFFKGVDREKSAVFKELIQSFCTYELRSQAKKKEKKL